MKRTHDFRIRSYIHALARHLAIVLLSLGVASLARAGDITGAGSTFVYPLMSKWAATYYARTGQQVNYQPTGSGNGIRQIRAASVTFGATDMPLKSEDLRTAGLAQFPIVIGGVVPVLNLDGVGAGQLRVTGSLLADIYQGKIVNWNDPAIAAANPGIKLPDQKIVVVHRSDSSGTTFNWTDYLAKVSPQWGGSVGAGTTVKWPVGVGANGNEGVATYIRNVKGSIGYVELTYALQSRLAYAAVRNRDGIFVQPSRESFSAAVSAAEWNPKVDFYQVLTNASGSQAWPITGVVFVLISKTRGNAAETRDALAFFRWALSEGQADAAAEHYVALPESLVRHVESYWKETFQ
ncbi:phosphate ABC transporter substrate-binding protein PstS (plasmid) [Cupriavidus sp. KK10]|jgi:phosphate transport system substrate-binding protein|uniref:phosphate ABC transporter substrate-binding protein PstS n=1 Tax=Cupriavidus sp. KK10 TaxID=1478019 RepID=UPI001BA55DE9|nr:phosphate ABC transporter substrate-binding protein PstS [Cupriavidus sp. KK10]QUN32273.1 phosphate ABC transporter substrate-binding protein PstS [Cupriavidus sp. KK10]